MPIYRKNKFSDEVYAVVEKEFNSQAQDLKLLVIQQAEKSIKEDMGGLTGSIKLEPIETSKWGFRVLVDVPYASYVNDGRREVRPKNKNFLSNYNTSFQKGHSLFVGGYASAFEGHHFMENAIRIFEATHK